MMLTNHATEPDLSFSIERIDRFSRDQVRDFFGSVLMDPMVGKWCPNEEWTLEKAKSYGEDKYWDGRGNDRVWFSTVDGNPVGYAAIEEMTLPRFGWSHCVSVGVLGRFQGNGIGRALIRQLIGVCDYHRMDLYLITLPRNLAMRATVESCGFQNQNMMVQYCNHEWVCYKYSHNQSTGIKPAS